MKTYLETDIDTVRGDHGPHDPEVEVEAEAEAEVTPPPPPPLLEFDEKTVIPPPPQFCQGFDAKTPFLEFHPDVPRYPYRSVSLPRGINMVPDEDMNSIDAIRVHTGRAVSSSAGQT